MDDQTEQHKLYTAYCPAIDEIFYARWEDPAAAATALFAARARGNSPVCPKDEWVPLEKQLHRAMDRLGAAMTVHAPFVPVRLDGLIFSFVSGVGRKDNPCVIRAETVILPTTGAARIELARDLLLQDLLERLDSAVRTVDELGEGHPDVRRLVEAIITLDGTSVVRLRDELTTAGFTITGGRGLAASLPARWIGKPDCPQLVFVMPWPAGPG